MNLNLFKEITITPLDQESGMQGFDHKGIRYIHHSELHHRHTAFYNLSVAQKKILLLILTVITVCLFINWHLTLVFIIALLTLLYFTDLLFNLFLIARNFGKINAIQISDGEIEKASEEKWAPYTILCPLYKEWKVLPQFIKAMSRMDYPKDKLQIMLLLEEDDKETIHALEQIKLPDYFDVRIIPHSLPKTKPKALNYGLKYAKGQYCVIYDAEDIPEPKQLKKAIVAFNKVDRKTICIQAKLNFYNPHQNILTRVFTAEYSLWFDLVLTGLQSINAPIPLGGTSNHFRLSDIKLLKGWDAFNVTEDCDLGIRLTKHGYNTAVIDSMTLEEANSNLSNWFHQRTRWIKGYIQTYFVHMRNPKEFITEWKDPHVLTFQLIVGGKILSMFINPIMWILTISYFIFRPFIGGFVESFFPSAVLYMAFFSLVFGNFLYMYYYMIGCAKRKNNKIIKYVVLVPFYWLAMSVAAVVAVYQIIKKPHYWAKTKHGLHLNGRDQYLSSDM